ncbi:interferon regulatory factor 3 isoform X3 [Brienomyrus brachyistius]|uniref:interferon regulatory factor 3 isoform X3 n=1 Tax=Brienomyrus brachyistius TaxID=42636 RepID=UPI0020B1D044|nr:interferon regulatory factor 3 isoform X3 [Brienomyrus brachyistius]
MATSRPLLIPWLVEQIESGRYPGLHWVNQEKTEFSVPWKHGLRQDSSGDDVMIFKAWAEITDVEGQRLHDPTVWKRNFRSALRAKGFQMIMDQKNNDVNPYKVFRFPEGQREASAGRVGKRVRRETKRDAERCAAGNAGSQELCVYPDLSPQFHVCEELYLAKETAVPNLQDFDQYYSSIAGNLDAGLKELNISGTQQGTYFNVLVYYRGVKVLEKLVENNAGFRVVFSPEQMHCDQQLETVILPSADQIPIRDQMQAQLTRRILEKLGAGLEVITQGAAVYALRRGDSHVYWSLCKHDRSGVPQEVSKQGNQLHTLKEFIADLLEFMKNKGPSPSCSLFFCLGEKWPDPSQRPWEKKLITIEVSLTSLELLKTIAVDGGASSLQSVDLQLSRSLSLMSSLEEMMDCL